jgi:hypothetical protein
MTREEAIEEIKRWTPILLNSGQCTEKTSEAQDMAISALSENKWIPVSERLPEMGVRVLCACQANLYDVLKLTPEGWFYDTRHTYMFGFVRAWQPLPEPYKGE